MCNGVKIMVILLYKLVLSDSIPLDVLLLKIICCIFACEVISEYNTYTYLLEIIKIFFLEFFSWYQKIKFKSTQFLRYFTLKLKIIKISFCANSPTLAGLHFNFKFTRFCLHVNEIPAVCSL